MYIVLQAANMVENTTQRLSGIVRFHTERHASTILIKEHQTCKKLTGLVGVAKGQLDGV